MSESERIEERRMRMAVLPRLTGPRRLIDLEGMTKLDWERVYWAYQGFMTQVWAVVKMLTAASERGRRRSRDL